MRYETDESIRLQWEQSSNEWRALFTRINLKRTIIATLPLTMQNFVGAPLFFGFTTYFFQLPNIEDAFLGNLIVQLVLVIGIVASSYMVDKAGRRTLVIYGGVFMVNVCFIVGGLGFLDPTTATGAALVTLCALWAFAYAISLAPIGESYLDMRTSWQRTGVY